MFTHLKSFEPSRRGAEVRHRRSPAALLFIVFCALGASMAATLTAEPIGAEADAVTDEAMVCHVGLCGGTPWGGVIVYNGDLIVAGSFLYADDVPVNGIARWDGTAWHALGDGVDGYIEALTIYDGKLIAGGVFSADGANGIAVWDGTTWMSFGSGLTYCNIVDLCVYDGKVVAAGTFTLAGAETTTGVIASDGGAWTALGDCGGGSIRRIHSYNGTLIAGGYFLDPNGNYVSAWNGTDWVRLGAAFNGTIQALATYNGELLATGTLTLNGARVAAWNGTAWRGLDTGLDNIVRDLTVYSGDLIAVGSFKNAGSQPVATVARWDGASWQAFGAGLPCCGLGAVEYGGLLAVCGGFSTVEDPPVHCIAAWDGTAWSGLSTRPKAAFAVKIEPNPYCPFGMPGGSSVIKADGVEDMYGFDLLISCDASKLTFFDVWPGELFGDTGQYQWEYFVWRIDTSSATESRVRVVGIADLNNGADHPLRTDVPDGTELFKLIYTAAPQGEESEVITPIRFQWQDCGDNTVPLTAARDTLALSRSVYDWNGTQYEDVTDTNASLPTEYGAPDVCFDSILSSHGAVRFVDFFNGWVGISPYEPIDYRGDINLNGIANEIADWVMFINYFFQGESVFPNPPASIAASDVNNDGLTLHLEDLVFLGRIICGDTIPQPLKNDGYRVVDSAVIIQDVASRTVSVEHPDTLAGLFLIFQGEITPAFLVDTSVVMAWAEYDGAVTRVMILNSLFAGDCRGGFVSGPLFTYTGDGLLIEKEHPVYPGIYDYPQAADFDDNAFNHNPIHILGTDGRVELWPAPLSTTLARINDREVVLVYLGNFDGHTVSDIDPADLRLNGSLVPTETTIFPSYEGFEGPVMRALFSARDFILSIDTLMASGTHVFTVNGAFTDEQTFVTKGLTTLAAEKAYIPVPDGWPTIQAGIDAAIDGDVVQVYPGTYTGDGNRDLDFGGRHITLKRLNDGAEVIIDCGGTPEDNHRFIHFDGDEDSTTVVDGFIIRNGYAPSGGAVLVNAGCSPDIRHCVFTENTAVSTGGAIQVISGSPTISWCEISRNTAGAAGGGLWLGGSAAVLTNCTIAMNDADTGTALCVTTSSTAQIDNTIIWLNGAGAFAIDGTSSALFTCTDMGGGYENEWTGAIAEQRNINGNMDIDPLFCGSVMGDYSLVGISVCLPVRNSCHALIGTYGWGCGFICGDINGNGVSNIGDAVFLIAYIFRNGPPPPDMVAADVNSDGNIDLGDAVAVVNYIFRGEEPYSCLIDK